MSRSAITIVTTGRTLVLKPVAGPNPMISQYIDTSNGAAVLFDRLGIELRPASANNDGMRQTHRLNLPVPSVVSDAGNTQGYMAAPRAAGENKCIITVNVSKFSNQSQTDEFVEAMVAYVSSSEFSDMIRTQLTPQ